MNSGACIAGALALALTVGGCGQDPAPPAPTPLGPIVSAPAASAGAVPPVDVLRARLLTDTDVPAGYAALTSPADLGLPPAPAGPGEPAANPAACAKVLAPVSEQHPGGISTAAVKFGGPGFGSIDVDAVAYPASVAGQAFTSTQQLLRQCGTYSGKDADGAAVSYEIRPHTGLSAGEAAATFLLRTTSAGLTVTSIVALVITGPVVYQLAVSGPREPDRALLERLARTQADRLRG